MVKRDGRSVLRRKVGEVGSSVRILRPRGGGGGGGACVEIRLFMIVLGGVVF
jgi:hypothetical protein